MGPLGIVRVTWQVCNDNGTGPFQEIFLTRTTIQYIDEMAFAGISTLRILHLRHTGMMDMPPLDPVGSTLEELNLDFNNISFVPRGYFSGFGALRILSIKYNILSLFPDITQLQFTITRLSLSRNIIQSIPDGFNGTIYPKLTAMRLAANRIRVLNFSMLASFPALQILNLNQNGIIQFPKVCQRNKDRNYSEGNMASAFLFLLGNPIHCGGKAVEDMISRRSDSGNNVDLDCHFTIMNLCFTKCASPAYLHCRDLGTLSMWSSISTRTK